MNFKSLLALVAVSAIILVAANYWPHSPLSAQSPEEEDTEKTFINYLSVPARWTELKAVAPIPGGCGNIEFEARFGGPDKTFELFSLVIDGRSIAIPQAAYADLKHVQSDTLGISVTKGGCGASFDGEFISVQFFYGFPFKKLSAHHPSEIEFRLAAITVIEREKVTRRTTDVYYDHREEYEDTEY